MTSYKTERIPQGECFCIDYFTTRAEEYVPKFHTHDHYVIYFFLRGSASYVFDDFEHHLVPGDIVIVPPGVMHCAWFEDMEAPYDRIIARVSPSVIKNMQVPGLSAAKSIGELAAKQEFCHSIPQKSFEHWKSVLLDYTKTGRHSAEAKLAMLGMLTIVVASVISMQPKLPNQANSITAKITSYIDDHFCEDLTIEHLAGEFFMSQSRLSHLFRERTGMSVHRYIAAKRIEKAKALLEQNGTPAKVCIQCGYQDYSSFYRAFTKETGMSPRDYAAEKE